MSCLKVVDSLYAQCAPLRGSFLRSPTVAPARPRRDFLAPRCGVFWPRGVTRAAAAGKRCLCFASVPGDALALHVTHTGNASSVVPGRLLASLPGSDRGGDGRADDAFDSCFAHPCTHLLRAVAADFAEGKREEAREMVARRKEHRAALKALKVAPAAEPRPEWHQKLVDEERDERRAERMMVAASRRQQSFAFGEREESSVARAQMLADYAAVAAAQAE